jgi:hypothetical protein
MNFLIGRISGRQQQIKNIYRRETLNINNILKSDFYKIFSFFQLANCKNVLVFLNIIIRDGFYLVRYPAILSIVFYNSVIFEKSFAFFIKFQNSIRWYY